MNESDIETIAIQRHHLPALYRIATIASGNAQKWLLWLTCINFSFLIIGAFLSAINISFISSHDLTSLVLYLGAAFLLLSTVVTLAMKIKQYEKKWYDGHSLAESVKTISWKYMMNSEPYRSERDPDERFRRDLFAILEVVAAGFEKTKADAIVETFSMAEEGVATKADTDSLKNEFELLRRDMQIWKRDVTIQVWIVGTAIIGVMAAFHFLG